MRLPAAAWSAIAAAARAAYPEECCGLLVGHRDSGGGVVRVSRAVETANVATPARFDRFEIDPRAHIALLRRLRGSDEAIVGHYHSHPGGPAAPSATDRERVFDPSLIWLIVAVAGERVEGRAYLADGSDAVFSPVVLVVDP